MLCLTCTEPTGSIVCEPCASQLKRPPDMVLGNGLLVVGGFVHEGPARRLVHSLKYRGVVAAAAPLAAAMVRRLPDSASMLVPVPRAWWRAMRYGVDPTAVLSAVVGRRSGLPVVQALAAPMWWRRHAGKRRVERAPVRFRQLSAVDAGAVLVDDVVTTGATVSAAARALEAAPTVVLAATLVPAGRSSQRLRNGRGDKDRITPIAEPLTARTDR